MNSETRSARRAPDVLMATSGAAPIIELIEAFRASKAMFVAVSLGVFDKLEDGECSAQDLARMLTCQPEPLERLLDACAALDLITKRSGRYANTAAASTYLCSRSSYALTGYILYSNQVSFPLWSHLESAIRQGGSRWKDAFDDAGGIFDQFFRTEGAMQQFLSGMHGFGLLSSPAIVAAFDLSQYRKFVDVGGATGHLAMAALARYPALRAVIFDLPRVIDAIREQASHSAFEARIELVKGDFFSEDFVPEGDLYGLGRILHDWPDEKVMVILEKISRRLPRGGGILIAEKLLHEDKVGPASANLQSLNMLVCTEGKERSLQEYRVLLERAGFGDIRSHVTGKPLDAIFARRT